jgi:Arc/MetJ family transcription regulator
MREGGRGRTTLVLDDDLVARAQALTGVEEKALLIREALKALIERESARRLARLGGSEPALKAEGHVILVHSSVWIDRLRSDNATLARPRSFPFCSEP